MLSMRGSRRYVLEVKEGCHVFHVMVKEVIPRFLMWVEVGPLEGETMVVVLSQLVKRRHSQLGLRER